MPIRESIKLKNITVEFDKGFVCKNINWTIQSDQHWLICGSNGSGKSALAAILTGAGDIERGVISGVPRRIGVVSFEAQAELIEAERRKDDADIMDVISEGTPVSEIIAGVCKDQSMADELCTKFGLNPLLNRAFRKLSTGESRKVMLIRALTCNPQLLILDEPFEGLDANSLKALQQHLLHVSARVPIVIVLNRLDQCPDFITHVAYVSDGELTQQIQRDDKESYQQLHQLLHLKTADLTVPPADPDTTIPALDPSQPLVQLTSASIKYGDTVIFDQLDWTINPGQHWQLSGPNGSGKTALLSLITGDHPQCYVNDISVFGFKRGSGESIWQIKQFIGYVSTALQWEYTVGTSLRNVIISGFYDSIGLYSKYTDHQRNIANQWLDVLGMRDRADETFTGQSYGDQRLLLIARAMVKHPPLLILDEPCLGLDDMNRQRVLALIEIICARSESTVLYVNHHAEDKIAGVENYLALGT
ncbi:molybdenum ABC transporter ATP-binding protein [Chromatiales bacterium (ex Bugula neritina AB1)]|nr:molybdenum ABC transporter ATP-binding protein [Chromatiales bacterium (ex Bugula neritina AB1)]